ncbi:MAG TPA: DNA primase [candidate division Zixibacteria bacterium]|nr:DNA primase [candidate division Zixibacteria bacterium]
MIKQEKIVEIRERASIVEIISDYVTLKRAGRNYMGLCPFHSEKTPSFTVSEEKGIFHCFGCHQGGSVFDFLMRYDHLSFPEAVERVAKRYGIAVERSGRDGAAGVREALYRLNERVAAHYQRLLFSRAGDAARAYLKSRGVDEATARRFMLGYAAPGGSGLVDLLRKEGLPLQQAIQLGLIGERGGRGFYEKFFARVMFPIADAAGKIVGFGGRVLDRALPKYLNSAETPLFRKGSTVYGLNQAKDGIRTKDRAVVVEGYLDAIALHQHGVTDAVATLGTALTVHHVRGLGRYTRNIVALFDGDEAGRKAAARSFEIFTEAGLFGRAAFLPKGEDPDTFVRKRGGEAVEALLEKAVPLADYAFTWLQERYGDSLEGKSRIAAEIGRVLAKIQNPVDVDLLVRRAVDVLGIREELLRKPAALSGFRPAPGVEAPRSSATPNRDDVAERSLISLMFRFPQIAEKVRRDSEALLGFGAKWRPLVDLMLREWQEQGKIDALRVAQNCPVEMAAEITGLALEGDKVSEGDSDKMTEDCLSHLRRKHFRALERSLRSAIRAAEEQKDEKAKRERILEWQDVVRKERLLDRRRIEPKLPPR